MKTVKNDWSKLLLIIAGLTMAIGTTFAYRHIQKTFARSSRGDGYQARKRSTDKHRQVVDEVDEQSESSFPASDSPSWSGSIAGGAH